MNPAKITTTVGLNIGTIDVSGVRLNFWDLGGQQELQSLWDKYYQESHGVIYVIDSNDRERMDESKEIFGQFKHFDFFFRFQNILYIFFVIADKMIKNELLSGVPLLILANKQDLPDVMGVRDIKPVFQQSGALIGRRDCLTMPVSALTGYEKKNHKYYICNVAMLFILFACLSTVKV